MNIVPHAPKAPRLTIDQLSHRYGRSVALDGVSFTVGAGELVALLGPNGAGKTTLFQILTGLFRAQRGHIAINGTDSLRQPTRVLADLGIVFQQPTLDLELSVNANLRFHGQLHGLRGAELAQRVETVLTQMDLLDRRVHLARELSGGLKRRLELARALLTNPTLLLLDEPTVGLDMASRRRLMADVKAHCAAGVGVLWATHLADEAEAAHRVIVLHKGQIVAAGSPQALRGNTDLATAFLQLTQPEVSP